MKTTQFIICFLLFIFTTSAYPIDFDRLSDDEARIMATLGVLEGIRSGTTTFVELGRDVEKYASAISDVMINSYPVYQSLSPVILLIQGNYFNESE